MIFCGIQSFCVRNTRRISQRQVTSLVPRLKLLVARNSVPVLQICCKRCLGSDPGQRKKYFITTPIFYVNAAPHIGHLYTCLIADAAVRWQRILGNEVIFSTGTDEHGLKIQQAASHCGKNPQEFCDSISYKFRDLFDKSSIQYTDYIRTTEERHRTAVHHFWNTLQEKGFIYKGKYEGWYSVSDEAFLSDDNVIEIKGQDGQNIKVSKESGHQVTWTEEENYMFKLSEFREDLSSWLDKNVIQPSLFETNVRRWVSDLRDLSVSRQRERLSWGINVPGDTTQTIYVWLDALVNYLTVGGYPHRDFVWPVDCHIVGKDIVKFHCVYWPAFLMAAGLEPPQKVLCHCHWTVDGIKMSKSLGNVINPLDRMEKYSPDAFRYYLLRGGVPSSDLNYTDEEAVNTINSELVNKMGNLLSRTTGHKVNPEQIFPRQQEDIYLKKFTASDREAFENLDMLITMVGDHYESFNFYRGVDSVMSYIQWANGLLQQHEPWVLAKSSHQVDQDHLKVLLHMSLETLRVSGILLQPIIPNISCRLLDRLGIPQDKRTVAHAKLPYLNSPDKLPLGPNLGVLMHRVIYP